MKDWLTSSLLAVALLGPGPLAFARDVTCNFQAKGLSLSFGTLDPSSGVNATAAVSAATLSADTAGDCVKTITMTIDGDGGQNYGGTRRLKSDTGSGFIPYTLVGLPMSVPAPGNTKYTTFTLSGVVLWTSYADAPAGNYSDTVMISVTP